MILYKTVAKEATAEQIIEKSRFIAHVKPVENRAEAEDFIAGIRTLHRNATHNVPAMVLGDKFQVQWASDDGEPQGTSGAPMVQMLVKEEITNVVLVITRYFGGIKLGTGGLVRAYTGTAKIGLEAAGICAVKEMNELKVKLDYTYLSKLQNLALKGDFALGEIIYEDMITAALKTEPENIESLRSMLTNMTGGKEIIISETKSLFHVPG